jgi:hypothetical protein
LLLIIPDFSHPPADLSRHRGVSRRAFTMPRRVVDAEANQRSEPT